MDAVLHIGIQYQPQPFSRSTLLSLFDLVYMQFAGKSSAVCLGIDPIGIAGGHGVWAGRHLGILRRSQWASDRRDSRALLFCLNGKRLDHVLARTHPALAGADQCGRRDGAVLRGRKGNIPLARMGRTDILVDVFFGRDGVRRIQRSGNFAKAMGGLRAAGISACRGGQPADRDRAGWHAGKNASVPIVLDRVWPCDGVKAVEYRILFFAGIPAYLY